MKNSKEHKVLPKLRFPEFVNDRDWEILPLGKLSKEITEKTKGRKFKLMSITSGQGLVSQIEKFGKEIAGNSYDNYYVLRNEDFAYNKSSTKLYPEGEIAMLEKEVNGAVPNSIFTCFSFDKSKIEPRFAKYPFVNNIHGRWLKKFIAVGARANGALQVNSKDLFSIPFPLTTLKEQQKIAACLLSLDEVIKAESQKLEVLKDHKKGLLQNLLPQSGETVPKFRFKQFDNSGDWEETTLTEVADYENGKAHEQDIANAGKFIVVNSKFISQDGEVKKFTNTAFLPATKGDVLMVLSDIPNGKAVAKCFLVEEDNSYTVNQRICRITPRNLNSKILYYLLNRNPYFLAFDDGVKQTNLRKEDVLNCPLLIPADPKEKEKIADTLSSVDDLIKAQIEKVEALQLHKKGLLQGLFPNVNEVTE
jgi:type I restriction enzyme S subunit